MSSFRSLNIFSQEPMSRSMQLHYISVTVFSQTDLFLDRISLEQTSRGSAMTNHKKLIDVTASLERNYLYLGCVRLVNPDLDLYNLDIYLDVRISNRTQNLTTDFVADSLIGNPFRVRISINRIRREIRFRILCSIGNPKIQLLRSKSRFPNRTHA